MTKENFGSLDSSEFDKFFENFSEPDRNLNVLSQNNSDVPLLLPPTPKHYHNYEHVPSFYEVIKNDNNVSKQSKGLKLKLRVSGNVGSVESSPNDSDDSEDPFNLEEFLNGPSTNLVTTDENDQGICDSLKSSVQKLWFCI